MDMEKDHLVVISNPRNMPEVPDNSVQLVIASPPYFDMNDERSGSAGYFAGHLEEMQLAFNECFRVLQAGRHICVNVCDVVGRGCAHPYPAHYVLMLQRAGFEYRDDIVWRKPTAEGAARRQALFIQHPCPQYYFPNDILAHILVLRKGKQDTRKVAMADLRQARLDIGEAGKQNGGHGSLPCGIAETLIKLYTCEGETVLDPFLGDGTTAAAAASLGRKSVSYGPDRSRLPSILQRAGIAPDRIGIIEQRRLFG